MSQDLESFLKELSELTKKYNIKIDGCGCCGSPYVTGDESFDYSTLFWNEETKQYTIS